MTTQRTREVVEEDRHDHDGGLSLDPPPYRTATPPSSAP
jgi:hypothetical protein